MKILMLCDFFSDNQEYQENLLTKYYIKNGHKVIIIASTFESPFDYTSNIYDSQKKALKYTNENSTIYKLPYQINLFNKLRRFRNIDQILNTEKPDLIFSHDIHLNLIEAVAFVKKNPSCKLIMDYHADYSNSGKNWLSIEILHKQIRKRILDYCKKYIHKIYPIVPASAIFLNEVYNIPYNQMELLPLGVDYIYCNEIKKSGSGNIIRQKLKIPNGALVIFTGGKLTYEKKTHILIEAVIKTKNTHLLIVGDASEDNSNYKLQLLSLSAKSNNIHFIGWINNKEVYDYMSASDIAIFPASQSVLWQQSIGMGLPLIVGMVGVQDPSYLNKNDNVIILKDSEITWNNIYKQIKLFDENRDLLKLAQRGAEKTASEILNYDIIAQKTLFI